MSHEDNPDDFGTLGDKAYRDYDRIEEIIPEGGIQIDRNIESLLEERNLQPDEIYLQVRWNATSTGFNVIGELGYNQDYFNSEVLTELEDLPTFEYQIHTTDPEMFDTAYRGTLDTIKADFDDLNYDLEEPPLS